MMPIMLMIVTLILSLGLASFGHGATLHVRQGGGGNCTTIGACINQSSSGDTITVHAGTYNEGDLNPKSNTTIQGATGETVIIRRSSVGPAFDGNNPNVTLRGFQIRGDGVSNRFSNGVNVFQPGWLIEDLEIAYGSSAGVRTEGNGQATIRRVHAHHMGFRGDGSRHCVGGGGGVVKDGLCHGVYIGNSNNIIENNDFYNNNGFGGQIYNGDGFSSHSNMIRNNRSHHNDHAGFNAENTDTWYNNLIYKNGSQGIIVYGGSNHFMFSNTFYQNGGGDIVHNGGSSDVRNTLYIEARGGQPGINNNGNRQVGTSCVQNAAADDYHLVPGCPAINQGIGLSSPYDKDFEGAQRPVGAAFDPGAYEFGGQVQGNPNFSFSATTPIASGGTSTLTWNVTDADSCEASMLFGTDTNWTGTADGTGAGQLRVPGGSSKASQPLTAEKVFRMSCTKDGITDHQDRTVSISGPEPSPDTVLADYPFEGNFTDIVSGFNLTPNGGIGFGAGLIGNQAASFNGTTQYLSRTTTAAERPTSGFCISAWINTAVPERWIWSIGDSPTIYILPNRNIIGYFQSASGYKSVQSTGVDAANNTPIHVVLTYDAVGRVSNAGLRLYINNAEKAFLNINEPITYPFGNLLTIGRQVLVSDNFFSGRMDAIRYYNGPCSVQGINNLFNESIPAANVFAPHFRFSAADAAEGTWLAAQNVNVNILRTGKVRLRWAIRNSGGAIDAFPALECRINTGSMMTLTNSCATFPVCIGEDSVKNMGDPTTVPFGAAPALPLGGFTGTPGIFVVDTINESFTVPVNTGQQTEIEYGLAFGVALNDADVVRCRPAGLNSYRDPLPEIAISAPLAPPINARVSGGAFQGGKLQ